VPITRRRWLGGALALPLAFLFRRGARAGGFGPLIPDPDGIFDLPAGFSYRVVERAGAEMDDGYRVPGLPDGMACFPGGHGELVLLRNHELTPIDAGLGPYHLGQAPPREAFTADALGGSPASSSIR